MKYERIDPSDAEGPLATEPHDGLEQLQDSTLSPEDRFDRLLRASVATLTAGASPWATMLAWSDWAYHMSIAPMRSARLRLEAVSDAARVSAYALNPSPQRAEAAPFQPRPEDRRFRDPLWRGAPFDVFAQAQLAMEEMWDRATDALPGMAAERMRRVRFMGKQVLQAFSPSNFALTNPRVLDGARASAGANFALGAANMMDDAMRVSTGRRLFGTEDFTVGKTMAATPGKVVYRNRLMELIQYAPTTERVFREPILIVPAWIMKYYILDLAPHLSLIRHLVDQGYTVFCMSWKNPDAELRHVGLDAYRDEGVMAALKAVQAIVPNEDVHAVGYCLGGTILAITAAAMVREGLSGLRSMTLLAAQTDFSEAGELMLFIDESQISVLEDLMNAQGYLDARQMSGAFYALRANDMFWARVVERYLIGRKVAASELDAWLSDATRMPERMHAQYLRWLFLENRFAQGNLNVDGGGVSLKDILVPVFAVGAEHDHIAPWRSVHKIALFSSSETTFVLSGGGHNTAIVSPPGKPHAHYRMNVVGSCEAFVDPDDWLPEAPMREGSWWPELTAWLSGRSSVDRVAPPAFGAPAKGYNVLGAAPGRYVLEP